MILYANSNYTSNFRMSILGKLDIWFGSRGTQTHFELLEKWVWEIYLVKTTSNGKSKCVIVSIMSNLVWLHSLFAYAGFQIILERLVVLSLCCYLVQRRSLDKGGTLSRGDGTIVKPFMIVTPMTGKRLCDHTHACRGSYYRGNRQSIN